MFGYRGFYITMLMLSALSVIIAINGAREARTWALTNEARATGMDWSRHIEDQLSAFADTGGEDSQEIDPASLEKLLSDVISIGKIYQIDYINPFCFCEVSIGSFRDSDAMRSNHDHTYDAAQINSGIPQGRLRHILRNQSAHAHQPKQTEDLYPLDRAVIERILQSNINDIQIMHGDGDFQPRTYAVVYHPVVVTGEPEYLLRVLVDLEDYAATFSRFFLIAVALSGLVIATLVGFPTWRYGRSLKRQQEADRNALYLAQHDVLTEKYNRNHFQAHLEDVLSRSAASERSVLLFMFDLSGLKDVNDYHGHHTGDRVLIAFAQLLGQNAPEGAYIARLGGDEFVVVLNDLPNVPLNPDTFIKLPAELSVSVADTAQMASVKIAGGAAQFPNDATTADALLQAADLAHYAAKQEKADTVYIYDTQMKSEFHARLELREEFKAALLAGNVRPYYQPIQNLNTGKIEGFEALARWYQTDGSIKTPAHFADVINDHEIGALLGHTMFEQIADQMAIWKTETVAFESVALNVVDADLINPKFADNILSGLASRGLKPRNLAIEVTENCLFHEGTSDFIRQLSQLRAAGCKVALDDFGTGYSSISQLKNLPFTAIKIDKSFVTEVLENSDDQAIVTALQYLGKSMSFAVVIEGIETLDQQLFFQKTGFALAQGYYIARPMPAESVAGFLSVQQSIRIAQAG